MMSRFWDGAITSKSKLHPDFDQILGCPKLYHLLRLLCPGSKFVNPKSNQRPSLIPTYFKKNIDWSYFIRSCPFKLFPVEVIPMLFHFKVVPLTFVFLCLAMSHRFCRKKKRIIKKQFLIITFVFFRATFCWRDYVFTN